MTKEFKKRTSVLADEVIKKGKYRVFNGTDYETVHLQTIADQVITTNDKQFVSQAEKTAWNNKSDASHKHDDRYYQKTETYTKSEVNAELAKKANASHTHAATDIITDSSRMFVSKAEKDRWNDTNTKAEVTSLISDVQTALNGEIAKTNTAVSNMDTAYKSADAKLQTNITTVQTNLNDAVEELTTLINNGGDANTALVKRVDTIEKTTIPGLRSSISSLESEVDTALFDLERLEDTKAEKRSVESDIAAAKTELTNKINLKADKSYTDTQLGLKANSEDVYTKSEVDAAVNVKADTTAMNNALNLKADKTTVNAELAKKANTTDVNNSLATKADKTALESGLAGKADKTHTHTASQITGLGTAATKNVGTANGNIPVLGANGKLATSVLPSIAVNQTFTADSITKAMELTVEVGDIVILNSSSAFFTKALASKSSTVAGLNEEFSTYLVSGKLAYLCVDSSATSFEEKFRPLQSSGDTISAGEVQSALNLKLDKSEFNTFKTSNTNAINLKANAADVYTKTQVDNSLNNKVDKVSGKGLSTNDFTAAYKTKLDGIAANANNYSHPTGDGNLHVPATGTTNNRKFLMAGSTAGSLSWTTITASHITQDSNNRFITDAERTKWNSKAEGTHTHAEYRLISDSLSTTQTKAEINKLKTVVQSTQPTGQIAGAVWIETL